MKSDPGRMKIAFADAAPCGAMKTSADAKSATCARGSSLGSALSTRVMPRFVSTCAIAPSGRCSRRTPASSRVKSVTLRAAPGRRGCVCSPAARTPNRLMICSAIAGACTTLPQETGPASRLVLTKTWRAHSPVGGSVLREFSSRDLGEDLDPA
eukprot:2265542-Prymnesium_polylepis.2